MGLKAIETAYKGYRFRSRMEARFAVFLDQLGLPYQYEPQGFDLDGLRYLPDFFLPGAKANPDGGMWIELKGQFPSQEECEKARRLALQGGQSVFVLFGDVWAPGQGLFFWPGNYEPTLRYIHLCCVCFEVSLVPRVERCACGGYFLPDPPRLMEAYVAAREARFEFGETPRW
jgi:hypothetical protein